MSSLFDLTGKTAIVTGSTKGIGEAIVKRFAEHGANVVVSSRKGDACDTIRDEINADWAKSGNRAISVPCNIGAKEDLQRLVDTTNDEFGKVDILVCNAAVNPFFGSSADIPDEAFDKIMASNVKSNHWLCQMVIPQMRERGEGAITIISSIGGLKGSAVLGAYGISKAADFALARNLATEFGPDGIRVNAIAPGLVQTRFAKALWDDPDILKSSTASAALKRIGQPDEIAGAAVFLSSPAGAFCTGHGLVVDGGSTITGG